MLRRDVALGGDRRQRADVDELREGRRCREGGGIARPPLREASVVRAGKTVSGASTITMQLARLLHPADRSWPGKMSQALWALRLEAQLSKQQIMEQYLNRVHLGEGTVGIGAASALYFGASTGPDDVSHAMVYLGDGLVVGQAYGGPKDTNAEASRAAGKVTQVLSVDYRPDLAGFVRLPLT